MKSIIIEFLKVLNSRKSFKKVKYTMENIVKNILAIDWENSSFFVSYKNL